MDFTKLLLLSPDGTLTDLSDPTAYLAVGCEGLGMASLHRWIETAPLIHGSTDRGFRLEGRRLRIALKVRASTPVQMFQRRAALLRAFRPSDEPLTLKLTLPDNSVRQLECYFADGLRFDSSGRVGTDFDTWVVLTAPGAAFQDPGICTLVFSWEAALQLRFPAAFPLLFGEGWSEAEQQIDYPGSWKAHPLINIDGPAVNPQIENASTGMLVRLEADITVGETVTIDTRPGRLSITNNYGQNLMSTLSPLSDLSSFCLEPGWNRLRVEAEGALAGATQISIEWQNQYIGI